MKNVLLVVAFLFLQNPCKVFSQSQSNIVIIVADGLKHSDILLNEGITSIPNTSK